MYAADATSFSDRLTLWGVDRSPVFPEMVLDFIERLAHNQKTPPMAQSIDELEKRRQPLKMRLRHSLGLDPWPVRTPLNPRKMGEIQRQGYKIEKLVYEAWQDLPVTAHLYLPDTMKKPCPGLVYACGHWMEAGKLAPHIQSFCATTAQMGIATLVYDPIGQGERLDSWQAHGNLNALLVGQCQLGLMVWESIRALDYLQTYLDVDPDRLGMTGASGGGLNTFFTTAIEDRFSCAIPVAYPCTFFAAMHAERGLNWEDGMDLCNQVPQVMSYAEMSDIASLFIPKPYMIIAGKQDRIFPINGTRHIASVINHYYQLVGASEKFRFTEFDEKHGFQFALRQAAYGWLKRWLLEVEADSPIVEPVEELFPDPFPVEYSTPPMLMHHDPRSQSPTLVPVSEALPAFCFSPPQVIKSEAIILDKIRVKADELTSSHTLPNNSARLPDWQNETKQNIHSILGPFPPRNDLHTRIINQVWESGLMVERVTFDSEDGITIPGLLLLPENWNQPVPLVIYAAEWGKLQGTQSGFIERIVRAGYGLLAVDVRGVGETAVSDFEAATNLLMMDRPLFGQRVWDLIRAVDFIWERCYLSPQIDKGRMVMVGQGLGGLWSLFAAALDDRLAGVVALDTLVSYKALLRSGVRYPASIYLFDVLRLFDIPAVIGSLAPRPVYIRPQNGLHRPCTKSEAAATLLPARMAYTIARVHESHFKITSSKDQRRLLDWLGLVLDLKDGLYETIDSL
jgi:cephalosporin-C deacetylase-like acetyl esterase